MNNRNRTNVILKSFLLVSHGIKTIYLPDYLSLSFSTAEKRENTYHETTCFNELTDPGLIEINKK